MSEADLPGPRRFLVLHDYGMGGLWWWIRGETAREIVENLAEVQVVEDPDSVSAAEGWELDEYELADVDHDVALTELRAQRAEQRDRPGFAALVGRTRVFLRFPPDEEIDGVVDLLELDAAGRRVRQIEQWPDGTSKRSVAADWPINSPHDLYDPQYAAMEIDQCEFEAVWDRG
ncbi:hypothetical protein [Actinoalloteichus hymeniacidonis]|uniref:Uncharacterized protein n=1 Tax=Actinoalloteichus hymeniacidonis TaxID=340345 RepID=A0AAC9MWD4_9PSEU|nr:hypothetical protein [Actinoalloteichus hymeniacidonis]AOS62083.1 hypothetical protein TL08_06290 [Actinoalloteichus hymeniacidonis]MBB5909895.1 hypothetical protein [Actinoalloteichus hymeniacidonis]